MYHIISYYNVSYCNIYIYIYNTLPHIAHIMLAICQNNYINVYIYI